MFYTIWIQFPGLGTISLLFWALYLSSFANEPCHVEMRYFYVFLLWNTYVHNLIMNEWTFFNWCYVLVKYTPIIFFQYSLIDLYDSTHFLNWKPELFSIDVWKYNMRFQNCYDARNQQQNGYSISVGSGFWVLNWSVEFYLKAR